MNKPAVIIYGKLYFSSREYICSLTTAVPAGNLLKIVTCLKLPIETLEQGVKYIQS